MRQVVLLGVTKVEQLKNILGRDFPTMYSWSGLHSVSEHSKEVWPSSGGLAGVSAGTVSPRKEETHKSLLSAASGLRSTSGSLTRE